MDKDLELLHQKIDFLTEQVLETKRKQQEWEELRKDLTPIASDVFQTAVTELDQISAHFSYECNGAFERAGLDYKKYVKIDKRFYRPAEVHLLLGDPSKAIKKLNWKPKVSFKGLVEMMVDHDLNVYQELKKQGNKPS